MEFSEKYKDSFVIIKLEIKSFNKNFSYTISTYTSHMLLVSIHL